ncbi:MAG: DUF3466 family protein, partial [Bacteroides sp.]|nr:DUF3466 family protein [Bacteroides sp.]
MVMTILFFCCTSLVMAADLNPPQSTTIVLGSQDNRPDEEYATSPESTISPSYLSPAQYIVIDVMPASGHSFSRGYGINNLSQVVGRTYNYNEITEEVEDQRALFWDLRTGSIALNTLDGLSGAWGVNDTGMACGFATNSEGYERAVRWNIADGTLIDLGTLTNPNTLQGGNESYAYRGINNAHTVVGHAEIPNDTGDFIAFHGFIY